MRGSHLWCALLMLGGTHLAYADDAATGDAPSMEVIEMLGGMDDEGVDLDIAMSKVKIADKESTQEVNEDEQPAAPEKDAGDKPSAQEVKHAE